MSVNNNKLWFRAKRYGWGWCPVSKEGWIVTLIYVLLLVRIVVYSNARTHSGSDFLLKSAILFVGLTVIFLAICYKKGEIPHWNWGKRND